MGTRLQLKATGFFNTLNQYKIWVCGRMGLHLPCKECSYGFESRQYPVNWQAREACWQFENSDDYLFASRKRCERKTTDISSVEERSHYVKGHAIEMRMSIIWVISSVGRASAWHAEGRRFEPDIDPRIIV